MGRRRIGGYVTRIREEILSAFREDHTPRESAGSFALGVFITMLPTFGLGLGLFVVLVAVFDWVNKIALVASVLVFNPVVKWGVYVASFVLGTALLGPVDGVSTTAVSLGGGQDIVVRLLLGNMLLAVLATVIGYVVVFRVAVRYHDTEVAEKFEDVVTELAEDVLEP